MSTRQDAIQEVEGKSEHMGHGKNQKHVHGIFAGQRLESKLHVRLQRAPGQHHPLGITRRAAGVAQHHQVVGLFCLEMHILRLIPIRITLCENGESLSFHSVSLCRRRHSQQIVHVQHIHGTLAVGPQISQLVIGNHEFGITVLTEHFQLFLAVVRQ